MPDLLLFRSRDLGRPYIQAFVDLESIAVHDLSVKPECKRNG
jgi:hypothetical protein